DVGEGRVVVVARERAAGGGGDAVALHERRGERLRPLAPRRRRARAEDADAGGVEAGGEPRLQRRLRPDDDEGHGAPAGQPHEPLDVVGGDGDVLGEGGGAGVAGGAEEGRAAGASGERVEDRVLAPPAPDDEDGGGGGGGQRTAGDGRWDGSTVEDSRRL